MATKKAASTEKPMNPAPKTEEVVNSKAFQQAKNKAEEYARDPEKAKNLMDNAMKKAKGKNLGPLDEVWGYLTGLIRMVRAYYTKKYTDVPWKTIVLVVAAIIYFVSPLDFIPDVIPLLGLTDDAIVIAFVVRQIQADLDNFLAWEISQQVEVITESAASED